MKMESMQNNIVLKNLWCAITANCVGMLLLVASLFFLPRRLHLKDRVMSRYQYIKVLVY